MWLLSYAINQETQQCVYKTRVANFYLSYNPRETEISLQVLEHILFDYKGIVVRIA